jgi:hypothetical protein
VPVADPAIDSTPVGVVVAGRTGLSALLVGGRSCRLAVFWLEMVRSCGASLRLTPVLATPVVCSSTSHCCRAYWLWLLLRLASCSLASLPWKVVGRKEDHASVGCSGRWESSDGSRCSSRRRTSVLLPLLNRALAEDSCMADTVYLGVGTLVVDAMDNFLVNVGLEH